MKDPHKLIEIQDAIWDSKTYLPKEEDGAETTYCNEATLAVAEGYGCNDLSGPVHADPLTADQMYVRMKGSDRFLQKPMADCQMLVNQGSLIFAALPEERLGQKHGHIVTLTPGQMDYSGHWDAKVPACLNLGRSGDCFRSRGVNYAFRPQPEFFVWVPTL